MKRYLLLFLALLAGCNGIVEFQSNDCLRSKTLETRERRVEGACLIRTYHGGVHHHYSTCLVHSHYLVHEHKEIVTCSKEEWVRDLEVEKDG